MTKISINLETWEHQRLTLDFKSDHQYCEMEKEQGSRKKKSKPELLKNSSRTTFIKITFIRYPKNIFYTPVLPTVRTKTIREAQTSSRR